jgi:hypothetical protein
MCCIYFAHDVTAQYDASDCLPDCHCIRNDSNTQMDFKAVHTVHFLYSISLFTNKMPIRSKSTVIRLPTLHVSALQYYIQGEKRAMHFVGKWRYTEMYCCEIYVVETVLCACVCVCVSRIRCVSISCTATSMFHFQSLCLRVVPAATQYVKR